MDGMDKQAVMLLTTVRSYRLEAFRAAAERLGVAVVTGLDLPPELADSWPGALPLPFAAPEAAAERIAAYAAERPLAAVLSVDDSGSLIAAAASDALGLPHNDPAAAAAARDKYLMRCLLRDGGAAVPWFRRFTTADDPAAVVAQVPYPCVVKPLNLNGSRGVMRADSAEELVGAIGRLTRLIAPGQGPSPQPSPEGRGGTDPLPNPLPRGEGAQTWFPAPLPVAYLVEAFIPGFEVALEGLLDDGRLRVLALFDKPDPLDGPFFEETIYVTPSRLPAATQAAIERATADAARALGLRVGPIHAELRVNEAGAWIVEVAGRSIGGLCSQVLRFGVDASLEELILRQAVGLPLGDVGRRDRAAGVMMIPIPAAGLLRAVEGVDEAAAVPLVTSVEITAPLHYPLTPLPEGDSYLGFIFARGETPAEVEAALRVAHAQLRFTIEPVIPLVVVS
jgi:biotin carboxylase